MTRVLIVGAGEIGSALGKATAQVASVDYWDRDPSRRSFQEPLEERAALADVVFLCTPSWVVREAATHLAPHLRREAVVIVLAKGVEGAEMKTMDRVLCEALPKRQRSAMLGGPLLAEELVAGMPGVGVFASSSRSAFAVVQPLFAKSRLRLEYEKDTHSVALTAVLKNIYAIALGAAEGLGWGWNGKGWLATLAHKEMRGIVRSLGGNPETVFSTAGMGDFLATAMSPDSRNRETGRELARTGKCESPGEGCHTLPFLLKRLGTKSRRFPLLNALRRVVISHEPARRAFEELLVIE